MITATTWKRFTLTCLSFLAYYWNSVEEHAYCFYCLEMCWIINMFNKMFPPVGSNRGPFACEANMFIVSLLGMWLIDAIFIVSFVWICVEEHIYCFFVMELCRTNCLHPVSNWLIMLRIERTCLLFHQSFPDRVDRTCLLFLSFGMCRRTCLLFTLFGNDVDWICLFLCLDIVLKNHVFVSLFGNMLKNMLMLFRDRTQELCWRICLR